MRIEVEQIGRMRKKESQRKAVRRVKRETRRVFRRLGKLLGEEAPSKTAIPRLLGLIVTPKHQVLVTVGGDRTSLSDLDYAISLCKANLEKTRDWCSPTKTAQNEEILNALIAAREKLKAIFWQ